MPATFTTDLPDVSGLILDNSVEDRITARYDDTTNYGEYRVEYRESGSDAAYQLAGTAPETDTEIVVGNLLDGEKYDVRLRAETEHVVTPWLQLDTVTIQPRPSAFAFEDMDALTDMDTLTVSCSWSDNADNPDEEYYVETRRDEQGTTYQSQETLGPTAESDTFDLAEPATTYRGRAVVETDYVISRSDIDTIRTPIASEPGAWIALVNDRTSDYRKVVPKRQSFVHEHTALSDFRAEIPADESELDDYEFSDVYLYDGTDFLFAASLTVLDRDGSRPQTTIGGYGAESELESGDAIVEYGSDNGTAAWRALRDYVNTHSPISGTVYEPTSDSVSGVTIQSLDSTGELSDATAWSDTTPLVAENGVIRTGQTCYFSEFENNDGGYLQDTEVSGSGYSGGTANRIISGLPDPEYYFSLDYTIPAGEWAVRVLEDVPDAGNQGYDLKVNGNVIESIPADALAANRSWSRWYTGADFDLSGEVTVTYDATGNGSGDQIVDAIALVDERYTHTFYDTAAEVLDGPQLYPETQDVLFDAAESQYNITSITATASMSHTDGQQAIAVRENSGSYAEAANAETVSKSLSSAAREAQARVTLGRTTTDPNTTPATGDTPHEIDALDVEIDGNTLGVVKSLRLDSDHLTNLQTLCKRAGMRFVVEHSATDDHTLEAFKAGELSRAAEWDRLDYRRKTDAREYANRVVGKGAKRSDGTRYRVVRKDSAEINAVGETVTTTFTDPSIDNETDLESAVRVRLANAVENRTDGGQITIAPQEIVPGYAYQSDALGLELPVERVEHTLGSRRTQTRLSFSRPASLAEAVTEIEQRQQETTDAV